MKLKVWQDMIATPSLTPQVLWVDDWVLAGGTRTSTKVQGHPRPPQSLGGAVITRQFKHTLWRRRQRHHPDHLTQRQPCQQPQQPPLRRSRRRSRVPLPGPGHPIAGPDGPDSSLDAHGRAPNPPALYPRQRIPHPTGICSFPCPLPCSGSAHQGHPAPPATSQKPLTQQRQRLHQHGSCQRRALHHRLQPRRQRAAALPLHHAGQRRGVGSDVRTSFPEGAAGPRVTNVSAARWWFWRTDVQRLGHHRRPVDRRILTLFSSWDPRTRRFASHPGTCSNNSPLLAQRPNGNRQHIWVCKKHCHSSKYIHSCLTF